MPVDFYDSEELNELGCAGYLKVMPAKDGACFLGALFVINARGEPVEFVYNCIGIPHPLLLQSEDARRFATWQLMSSVLKKCASSPYLFFGLQGETDSNLFSTDLRLSEPICLVQKSKRPVCERLAEDVLNELQARLSWVSSPPSEGSVTWNLLRELCERNLLEEPFERAAIVLQDVYADRSAK